MIKLGEINYNTDKHTIDLELASLVENNLTQHQSQDLQVAWHKLATLIDTALKKSINGEDIWTR